MEKSLHQNSTKRLYRALKNVMLDYDMPQLAEYWNDLEPKETSEVSSKKGKKKKGKQNTLSRTTNATIAEQLPEHAPSQEGVEDMRSGAQEADNGLQSVDPQYVSRPKSRKRKRKKSEHQNRGNVPRKKTKTTRPQIADEGFDEAQNIHEMPGQDPHQRDDSGIENETAEGVNNVPVRIRSANARTVRNQPSNSNQSGTTENEVTRLENNM